MKKFFLKISNVNLIFFSTTLLVIVNNFIFADSNKIIYFYSWGFPEEVLFNRNDFMVYGNFNYLLREELNKIGYSLKVLPKIVDESLNKSCVAIITYNILPSFLEIISKNKWMKTKQLIAVLWEPEIKNYHSHFDKKIHAPFSKIFTWNDDLVDNNKYLKFNYPQNSWRVEYDLPFEGKNFCVMINGYQTSTHPQELCSERLKVIEFFEKHLECKFQFYGFNWPLKYKNYKGPISRQNDPRKNQLDILKNYKFCICYENSAFPGYISFRLFDCFAAGCIPVYLGATNIEKYVPKNCFIDARNFFSLDEMYKFMRCISQKEYEKYIENIKAFFSSDLSQFSNKLIIDKIIKALEI